MGLETEKKKKERVIYRLGTSHIDSEYWASDENPPPTCIDNNPAPLRLTTSYRRRRNKKGRKKKTTGPQMILARAKWLICSTNRPLPPIGRRKTCELRERGQATTPFRTPVDHGRGGESGHAATRGHRVNKSIKGMET